MTTQGNSPDDSMPAETAAPARRRLFRPMTVTLGIAAAAALIALPLGMAAAKDWRGGWHGGWHGGPGPMGHGMRADRMIDRMFEEADANDDGVISAEEIAAQKAERFKRLDVDGDGEVTLEEIAAAQERARQAFRDMRATRRIGSASGFVDADTDDNGSISAAEFAAMPSPRLDRVDANDDGAISREEAEAVKERMRERRWHRKGRGMGRDG